MAVIETKFSIGDVVYHASTQQEQRQHDCPDCKGTRRWAATSPAGDEFTFACPRCSTSYSAHDDMSLKYTAVAPCVRRLTVGSVRYDSHGGSWGNEAPASYMCNETGVGSGSIYYESDLFATEAEAMKAAELKAAAAFKNTEWIAKRFNKTLEISDYQLSGAALKLGKDAESRAWSILYNINDLFATIEEADDKEAILEAVSDYKRWHYESDMRAVAAGIEARSGETGTGSTGTAKARPEGAAQPTNPTPQSDERIGE